MNTLAFWQGKKVLITGHTGFKGGWLALWLQHLGADVYGVSIKPPTMPSLFVKAEIEKRVSSFDIDIRDLMSVKSIFSTIQPEIVFHLAAQSLVRESYKDPVGTYATNVMGSLHVLEAVRECDSVRSVVMITTDKCYENQEWLWAYRENEPMGGHDPYSSSKGCAELLIASYRRSFFSHQGAAIASARAGNVIGGGDWAESRLIPDIIRSFQSGNQLIIRSPLAIRPWQHVLEPLSGYLMLARCLFSEGANFAEAWNFGPKPDDMRSVEWIVKHVANYYPQSEWLCRTDGGGHEAGILKLDSTKANVRLGWQSCWSLEQALAATVEWFKLEREGGDIYQFCLEQIDAYQNALSSVSSSLSP